MIEVEKNVSLKSLNTFGIDAKASFFCRVTSTDQLQELLASEIFRNEDHYILGGGSNILFTRDFNGLIIKVATTGHEVLREDEDKISVRVLAGTNWHEFVRLAVNNNWGGIENLSLIPGTMGAAPIQNIGAYGVEIKNVINSVETIELLTGAPRVFTNADCQFGYRESIFKGGGRKKFFISSVTLTLTKKNHILNIGYGALQETLHAMKVAEINVKNISDAVTHIRQSKLPDPAHLGNAGSFFKNPTLPVDTFLQLQKEYPTIPSYPIDNQNVKVPAAWLIEQCGWKGKKINHVGVHPMQALVLVNYGDGTGEEILNLSEKILNSVQEKFQIALTPEVNIL